MTLVMALTNVHEALALAASAVTEPCNKKLQTRVPRSLYDACAMICAAHGTDVSSFVRECMEALVRDYANEAVADAPGVD